MAIANPGPPSISDLPENCISHILSLTTPRDVCRSSAVSSSLRSAADSDYVWERILPPDYLQLLSRSVSPIGFSSKKDLFFHLCSSPLIIDSGTRSFSLEKSSGKKCFVLSARELHIAWGEDDRYWRWIPLPDSRFSVVAELLRVCWLEIRGAINATELSPRTQYAAYFILKHNDHSFGFHSHPAELSVSMSDRVLSERRREIAPRLVPPSDLHRRESDGEWMEVEIGEFSTDDEVGNVEFGLKELGGHWKFGLVLEGIEIRPKMNPHN